MLKSISLKFTELDAPIVIPADGITVFVGPNNSGKSLVLRELERSVSSQQQPGDLKIIADFEITWPDYEGLDRIIKLLGKEKAPAAIPAENIYLSRYNPGGQRENTELRRAQLEKVVKDKTNKHWFASQVLRFLLIRLDGRTRFDLTNDQPAGDLIGIPPNILAHLFQDEPTFSKVHSRILDAFSVHFVIDPTLSGQLRIRLSETAPEVEAQSLNQAAREYHRKALYIKDASDGVQAYVGLITAVLSGEYTEILIDEPEAFLHPPLARKLGFQLATIASERSGSLFASTHSADFLIGCVQAAKNVRVVRLEYSNGKSKGKIVDPIALQKVFRSPLMRSANVISSLLHDGVVVTESDNDRAFYSEIYYRLAEQETGYPSVLFVNAQNKQTIRDIIEPLRRFGIPAVAVPDIDILKDGGETWGGWMAAAQIPSALRQGLAVHRDTLKKRFEADGKDMKGGGVNLLKDEDKAAANELFDSLDEYGVFVVRKGELETWLPRLGAVGKKTSWTLSALEKMGSDPAAAEYLRPGSDDVWEFIRGIVRWIKNPARKGTS